MSGCQIDQDGDFFKSMGFPCLQHGAQVFGNLIPIRDSHFSGPQAANSPHHKSFLKSMTLRGSGSLLGGSFSESEIKVHSE